MGSSHAAFLGIGSNLGDRLANCERAVALLREEPGIRVIAISPWKEYPALTIKPDERQPNYYNGVVRVETSLAPMGLLTCCRTIEAKMGRRRDPGARWQPRTIDLDILLYDSEVIQTPELTIPHPGLLERRFVLEPLVAIAPTLVHPVTKRSIRILTAVTSR